MTSIIQNVPATTPNFCNPSCIKGTNRATIVIPSAVPTLLRKTRGFCRHSRAAYHNPSGRLPETQYQS